MEVTDETRDGVRVLAPSGRLDTNTSGAFEARLMGAVKEGARRFVVDLAQVDYVSSAGLRVLLMLAKKLKDQGGSLALCGLSPPVRQTFELTGFIAIFTLEPTRDAAVARLAGPPPA